jgi:hypothetical protein
MLIKSLILSSLVGLLVSVASPPASATQGCIGCIGSGGTASASGGTCGSGFVSITVTVASGRCRWFRGIDPEIIECIQFRPCVPQVTRTWSGLSPGSALDFCVTVGDDTLCLSPTPAVGPSGGGSDARDSAAMGCSDDPDDTRSFSITSASCGLSASVNGSCSACTDG